MHAKLLCHRLLIRNVIHACTPTSVIAVHMTEATVPPCRWNNQYHALAAILGGAIGGVIIVLVVVLFITIIIVSIRAKRTQVFSVK